MPDQRVKVAGRFLRRRYRASAWQSAVDLLQRSRLGPRRASAHLLVLSIGLMVVLATAIGRLTVAPLDADGTRADAADTSPGILAAMVAEAAPDLTSYIVEPGDTLKAVAARFGLNVATIAAANKLPNPDLIRTGQELTILPAVGLLHAVNQGETLHQVAARYGVEATELARVNRIGMTFDAPLGGSRLLIPGVEPSLVDLQAADMTSGAPKPRATPRAPVIYEVQDGDSLSALASQFGVSVRTILLANNVEDPNLIAVGTRLRVLPITGVEHRVGKGETLADIAAAYKVDLGPIIDANGLASPDKLAVDEKLLIPGAASRAVVLPPAPMQPFVASAPAPRPAPPLAGAAAQRTTPALAAAPAQRAIPAGAPALAARTAQAAPAQARILAPAAPTPAAASLAGQRSGGAAASILAPVPSTGAGGGGIVANAMKYQGAPYAFGGTSPAGFDCSGFVWFVHKQAGVKVSRGMPGQLNGGQRIVREALQPGDTVFFANTYMPGLSHNGIYIGNGNFIHAIDSGRGVGVSNLGEGYWSGRYVGATRIR